MELESLKEITECYQDFECIERCSSMVCAVNDRGLADFVECHDEESRKTCVYGFPFGSIYLCNCPMAIYLCNKNRVKQNG